MEILTSADMKATDRRTAEEFGFQLSDLMERAGDVVARFSLGRYPQAHSIIVLCGKGNNGGDGMVAARILALAQRNVKVLLLGRREDVKAEAAQAMRRLLDEAPSAALHDIADEAGLHTLWNSFDPADLLLDAVVGTGFKPPLRGLASILRGLVEVSAAPVVAVDLPSGWDADSMEQKAEAAYRADAVVTFTRPKLAHVFGQLTRARKASTTPGPVVVAEIGSPAEAIVSTTQLTWAGSSKAIAERPRDANSNKGKFGHVLILGGSYGTSGAPAMASLAALRTGAGLVTAAVPGSIVGLVAAIAPELMVSPMREGPEGAVAMDNLAPDGLEAVIQQKKISVIAIGPGLSTRGDASAFARVFVGTSQLPLVIDADALNAFESRRHLLYGEDRVIVLTPHPGEMARLMGMTVKEVEADRIGLARSFATEHKVTLVLKGWRTLIAHPDGSVAVNTTGNPAMAKGGSGDILTGIVAAMLAQYPYDVARAVEAAVFLHGLAGDFAAQAMDEHTVLATDTVNHLSAAFRYRTKDEEDMTWICGVHD